MAINAGIGPEIHQDNLSFQLLQVNRLVAGGVEPLLDALDAGCGPARLKDLGIVAAFAQVLVLRVDQAANPQCLLDLAVLRELALQRAGLVGNKALQRRGQVEQQPRGKRDHEHAAAKADGLPVLPE